MKPNYTKLSIVLLGLFYIALVMFFLYGCSANYHFGKFIKKGGKIENKTEYIETTDTIRINGKDSIITVRVPMVCPEIQIPPTRTEIRYKYKLDKRKLKAIEQMYNDSIDNLNQQLKYAFKTNKTDKKAETKQLKSNDKKDAKIKKVNIWIWFLFGTGVGAILMSIIIALIDKLLSK